MSVSDVEEVDGTCNEAPAEGSETVECGGTDGIEGSSRTESAAPNGIRDVIGLV